MGVTFDSKDAGRYLRELNFRLEVVSQEGVAAKRQLREAITKAAQPIADEAKRRVHRRSGELAGSIRPNRAVLHRGGGMKVTVSAHGKPGRYAGPLEFGHAASGAFENGPDVPANPFLRPAFDAKKDEAYARIVAGVLELMNDLGV